jgi:hypothetical protein
MREVQASEAKTHLPQLLDDVERAPSDDPSFDRESIFRLAHVMPRTSGKW